MTIGERIKSLRVILGWSQSELAERSGLQPAAISHIECNRRIPRLSTLTSVREAFGISWDHFLEGVKADGE